MSESLVRLNAALADRYRIEHELGAGGMATVYLAHDVKHDRKVALKVLRPELAAVIGAERFLAEIRTTANLQHPHILPLFDSGSVEGTVFFVMPYIEGETLRGRLAREKQLPVDDAVRIAGEVASALDYAHRQGVIHRDIKPENILLHDGQALVADFGIALAVSKSEGGTRMTETGMSLGTPHYMSPEQAMGEREITARSDVYALGAMLYEMLVGEPPFTGPTAQAIVAKVLTASPEPLIARRHTVPPHVEAAVLTALEKLPADRFASAAEFEAVLSGTSRTGGPAYASPREAAGPWRSVAFAAVAFALGMLGLASWAFFGRSPASQARDPVRFTLDLPDSVMTLTTGGGLAASLALSPDGQTIVYVGVGDPETRLYRRRLSSLEVEAIPGSDGADTPFFSPDGRWLGFRQGNRLRKVDLLTGSAATLTTLERSTLLTGASWGANDTIYLGLEALGGLFKVAAGGSPLIPVAIDSAAGLVYSPSLLPNERWLLATGQPAAGAGEVNLVAISLEDGTSRRLIDNATWGRYLGDGQVLVLTTDGSLMTVPFNPDDPQVTGSPLPVAETVQQTASAAAQVALADNGTAVFLSGGSERNTVVEVDRAGAEHPLLSAPQGYKDPRYSPDGGRLAFEITSGNLGDLWIYDLASATTTRLTFGSENLYPVWTPDGRRIAYTSRQAGLAGLWWTAADGSEQPAPLIGGTEIRFPGSFTPDGQTLLYREISPQTGFDIYALPLEGDREPRPVLVTPFNESSPELSPDGRWLAYVSDQSGRYEIYLRAYPEGGAQWQVSAAGGTEPVWNPDGRELYYRQGQQVLAARLGLGEEARILGRDSLFAGPYYENVRWPEFDVHPDGDRFVFVRVGRSTIRPVVVINWRDELARRSAEE